MLKSPALRVPTSVSGAMPWNSKTTVRPHQKLEGWERRNLMERSFGFDPLLPGNIAGIGGAPGHFLAPRNGTLSASPRVLSSLGMPSHVPFTLHLLRGGRGLGHAPGRQS